MRRRMTMGSNADERFVLDIEDRMREHWLRSTGTASALMDTTVEKAIRHCSQVAAADLVRLRAAIHKAAEEGMALHRESDLSVVDAVTEQGTYCIGCGRPTSWPCATYSVFADLRAALVESEAAAPRDCLCPDPNPDCEHPTCPRFVESEAAAETEGEP
jgi:hypothetical protein